MLVTQTMRRWSRRASVFALSFAMVSGTVPASAMEQIASEAEAQAASVSAQDASANAGDASEDELAAQLANDVSTRVGEDQLRCAEELKVRLASAAAGVADKTDTAALLLALEKTQYESDSEAVAQAFALVAQNLGIACEVQEVDGEGTYQNLITIDGVAYTLNASTFDASGAIRAVEQLDGGAMSDGQLVADDEELESDELPGAAETGENSGAEEEAAETAEATESGEPTVDEGDVAEAAEAQTDESKAAACATAESAAGEAASAADGMTAEAATSASGTVGGAAAPTSGAVAANAPGKAATGAKAASGLGAQADAKTDLSKATVAKVADQLYTGKAITPDPKVTLGGKTLRKGTDYALSYKANTKVGTATVTATGKGDYSGTVSRTFKIVKPAISYAVHVQGIGDQSWRKDGKSAGTFGESRRLESIKVKLSGTAGVSGGIEYRTHVQGIGWEKSWAADGAESGTRGQSRRLEAIQMRLTGDLAKAYDVYYRVHAQNVGWMSWAKNGAKSGTAGMSWRLEAIQVVLVPKGQAAPSEVDGVTPATKLAMLENPGVTYHTHVQTYGWMDWVRDGELSGTSGESKRLEALEAKLASSKVPGSIRYAVHVQSYGWQDVRADGAMAGTSGESKRLEAIRVELKGEIAKYFDVWYRTHVQTYGWLGWANNTHDSGTANLSRRMEALEIRLVPKGRPAPGSTENAFIDHQPSLSGDAELDAIVDSILARTGRDGDALRKAFDYVVSLPYIDGEVNPAGDWRVWSIPKAKQMYRRPGGNCYYYGALMAWLARGLGYDARAVSGEVKSGVLSWSYHGWCEITLNGTQYVLDPDLQKYISGRNFFMVTYDEAPTYYTAY